MLLILPWAVPNYITALIWKGMFHHQYGAVNHAARPHRRRARSAGSPSFSTAFTANVVTNTWLGFPFMMVVALGALQSIPGDLYEAADGGRRLALAALPQHHRCRCSARRCFPAIILGSIWTFNMFNIIYLVSARRARAAPRTS